MTRQEWPEIEDQPWTPAWLRGFMTDFLRQLAMTLGVFEPVVPLVERLLAAGGTRRVVDLCSGAGGPWPSLLKSGWDVRVTATDLRPHASAKDCGDFDGRLHFELEPVPASRVPAHLAGVRTLFSGLHHLDDDEARAVLEDAARCRVPLGAFEFTERSPGRLVTDLVMSPLLVLLLSLRMRPRSISRCFWTYALPIVPLAILWDAIASDLRTRTVAELEALVASVSGDGYQWEAGTLDSPRARARITYLIGVPVS